MITETRQNRTHRLHTYERHSHRRYHTLDNATLDKFNFICVPLHPNETHHHNSSSLSQSNLTSNELTTIPKSIESSSSTRRVRFKFDENQLTQSSDDIQEPKKFSVHRVECQIPIHRDMNSSMAIDCSSNPAKTRSITSQKIDINYPNNQPMPLQGTTSINNSPTLSTIDSDKKQTEWYKEMYGQIHKSPEKKKDVILVKIPPTSSRYRKDYQRDDQQNPYKPTYTFPEEFDGNLERMENYIRKAASEDIEDDDEDEKKIAHSENVSTVKDHRTIHFDDRLSSPTSLASTEQTKSNNNHTTTTTSSSITINTRSNTTPTRTSDDEKKSIYKRILRGGEIPSTGLQKLSINNREFRWHVEPLFSGFNKNRFKPILKSDNKLCQKSNDDDDDDRLESNQYSQAHALYNFYAQSNRELSFKKGDIILIKRRINDDWFEGEYQGKIGIFPTNYVELLPYEPNEGEGIAKYDFIAEKISELQLRKGDKVILLRKLDNNWYEGRLNQMEGIFPADHIEILREPKGNFDQSFKQQSNQNETLTKMPKSVLKNSTGFQQTAIEKMNIVPQTLLPKQKCQVLYDYTPQNPDELEIHVGDIINIIEMCDDGWYCGLMEKSNHENNMVFGTFPGNYVKILPM